MKSNNDAVGFTPTEEQFNALNGAFNYFNQVLFDNLLPGCILNFSRKKNTHGFLAPERWRRIENKDKYIHEISLTPYTFYREPRLVFSTLVHEMAHLWQWEYGSPSRNGYHNKEWASKMEEIGLIPSHNGKPNGKKTGQQMTHCINENGAYDKAFADMPDKFRLPFTSLEGDIMKLAIKGKSMAVNPKEEKRNRLIRSGRKKTKYSCQSCGVNVWGKPKLRINCGTCEDQSFIEIL